MPAVSREQRRHLLRRRTVGTNWCSAPWAAASDCCAPGPEERHHRQAGDEAADMRIEGNAALLLIAEQDATQLHDDPPCEQRLGRQVDGGDEEIEEQHADAGARK